jgi:hypothetical protein
MQTPPEAKEKLTSEEFYTASIMKKHASKIEE